jgi:hypothetical protein
LDVVDWYGDRRKAIGERTRGPLPGVRDARRVTVPPAPAFAAALAFVL